MRTLLEKTRVPKGETRIQSKIGYTAMIIIAGFALGILQKWIDGSATNLFPMWFQQLDIRNYFGRLSIWILLSVMISVYSSSPVRASVNTASFLLSMVAGYYLYAKFVLGFLSVSYMMLWIVLAFLSVFLSYFCWYAKGEGAVAVIFSGIILGVLFAQAFSITQGFYIYHWMEVVTWLVGMAVLYRKPKEFAVEVILSLIAALIYQLILS